jgi:hypothetical protein
MSRIREDIHQERDIRHQCKKCGNLWVGPASEEECPKCHAREYDESVLLKAIRGGDHLTIAEALGQVMRAKVRTRLAEEKVNVAATLLYPKIAEANITEGFRSGEKVVLAHCTVFGSYKALDGKGQYRTVPIGSTGEYVRAKDSTWSIVWFPEFYESASVKTEDLVPVSQAHLYERKMAKCSVCGKERTLDDEGLCHECWQDRKDKELGEGFIIVKATRGSDKPYNGVACDVANVPRGKVYASKAEAEADAAKLTKVNKAGFEVIEESVGWLGSTPGDLGRMAAANEGIKPGDRVRTKRMGQTPGTVVKVENGNVYFELDEPAGKYGKRVWAAPLSNIVKEANEFTRTKCRVCEKPMTVAGNQPRICAQCAATQKAADSRKKVNEATVSHHEVQRIYDEIGDVGETELLCGISNLRVNGNGQVISYICEGRSLEQGIGTSPENGIWLKGKYPLDHPELNQFGRPKPEPNKYCWQCQKPIRNLSRCPFCSEKQ